MTQYFSNAVIISLVNQKGGTSKSTTSVHFAYWLNKQGKNILVVDADAQQSSSHWISGMGNPISCKVIQSPDDLLEQVPELASQHDYVVVPEKVKDQVKSGISAEKYWLKIARKYSNPCKIWRKQGFLASLKDLFFRDAPAHLAQI